ncbi:MAG: alpha-L-fucosidase [Lentisphaerota bacterium]
MKHFGDGRDWFFKNRYGMFIHWGIYSVDGWHEQAQWRRNIPKETYVKRVGEFNPVKYDPDAWCRLAKEAGMDYMIITAKHHDGFAMFNSPSNPYNIVEATPFRRDPMKELAAACRKSGIRLCFYYSQAQDWHAPGGAGKIEESVNCDWSKPTLSPLAFARYLEEKVKPQVRELLTQYGPVGLIWFDTPIAITLEQSRELRDFVHRLQPECLVSGRVGHGIGDYGSLGDNKFPDGKVKGDWETPATLNDTWGFKTIDRNWKSVGTLLYLLANCASKGVNYLLNVGPTGKGAIPKASMLRLNKIGDWLKVNGAAIYGTQASPYDSAFDWGWVTQKDGKLYLLFRKWPRNGRFILRGLRNKTRKASLLANPGIGIKFTQSFDKTHGYSDVELFLPTRKPDRHIPVVALDIDGKAAVRQKNI